MSWIDSYKLIKEKNHSELDSILQTDKGEKAIVSWIESSKLTKEKIHSELD